MFRFKVLNNDNRTNAIYIQGARANDTSNDIASIVFQNYDSDTNNTYNMASIALRDEFGNSNKDGFGDLIFRTNIDGSNLNENMRITYDGHVLMGTTVPQEKLTVDGGLFVSSNIVASNATFCNLTVITTSFSNQLDVWGPTLLHSTLTVSSNITASNSLTTFGALTVNNNTTVNSNLYGYGTNTMSNLNVYGGMTCYSNVYFQGDCVSSCNIQTGTRFISGPADSSNAPGYTWSNDLDTGLFHPEANTLSIVTSGSDRARVTSTGRVVIGNSNAREMLEVYKGNVVSKNITRLTKTLDSLSNIDITMNWEGSVTTDQYYIVLDTCQQVANGSVVGERSQRHLVRIFNASNSSSPTIRTSQAASTFGNAGAASSLSISSVYIDGTSLTIRSSTNWNTTGTLTHSFTADILQVPDVATIGFVWFT